MWYCSECGKKNNGKFCTRCGTKYVEIEEEPQVSAVKEISSVPERTTAPDGADRFGQAEASSQEPEVCNAAALCRRSVEEFMPIAEVSASQDEIPVEEETPPQTEEPIFEAKIPLKSDEPVSVREIVDDRPMKGEETENLWVAPYLREEETPAEAETSGVSFIRRGSAEPSAPKIPIKSEEPVSAREIVDDRPMASEETENRWVAPYLREEETPAEEETAGVSFIRRDPAESPLPETEDEEETLSADRVFTHRLPPKEEEDREWRYSKRVLFSVGAVGGVVLLALLILVGSLFVFHRSDDEPLPVSSGVYAYVSGVKDTTPLYADKSIKSDVLAELKNGDAVEYLEAINSEFAYVLDPATEQYGYVRRVYLVNDENDVDYGNVENKYDDEKSLGYFYVTKVKDYLTLWENPDGGGVVKAKMECGYKVSLLEKTNDSYWYVFDYTSAERGYVRCSYLTDSKSKVVYPFKEPKDKTIIGEFYVTGVKNYLPIYSRPNTGGDVRGKLNNGDKVGLIEKTNGSYWYIGANGVYGWVSASYLTATPPTPEPAPTPTPEPTPAPPPDTSKDYKVTGTQEYLPILNAASADAAEVARLHNGDTVKVIDSSGDTFWYIEVPSTGVKGYVVKDYLTK